MDGKDMIGYKKAWYAYSVCMSLLTNNCHYIFYPVILSKMYGTHGGLLAYSVGFTFVSISTLTNTAMLKFLYDNIGFKGVSWIYAGLLALALFILIFIYRGSMTKNGCIIKPGCTLDKSLIEKTKSEFNAKNSK